MSKQNFKIIYSLRIHLKLQEMGFKYLTEMKNPQNMRFNCWVYEATPQLLEAFDNILREVEDV
jgi:hypothetical protein